MGKLWDHLVLRYWVISVETCHYTAHPPVLRPNLPDCPSLSRQLTVRTSSTSIVQLGSQRTSELKVRVCPGGHVRIAKNTKLISVPYHGPLKFVVWERDYGTIFVDSLACLLGVIGLVVSSAVRGKYKLLSDRDFPASRVSKLCQRNLKRRVKMPRSLAPRAPGPREACQRAPGRSYGSCLDR